MGKTDRCAQCDHLTGDHFETVDELGRWSFCTRGQCDCFIDDREEETDLEKNKKISSIFP